MKKNALLRKGEGDLCHGNKKAGVVRRSAVKFPSSTNGDWGEPPRREEFERPGKSGCDGFLSLKVGPQINQEGHKLREQSLSLRGLGAGVFHNAVRSWPERCA